MVKLCASGDIPEGKSKGFHLDELSCLVIRRDGILYAYLNACPHLGIPLEWQPDSFLDDDAELIQCATHGALFLIESGLCVSGPCVNQNLTPLRVDENNGEVFVHRPN